MPKPRMFIVALTTSHVVDITKQSGERRSVKHFHYTTWPDKSVPDDGTSLVELRRRVKQAETEAGPPVVVHCR